jgi:hypothetical protein
MNRDSTITSQRSEVHYRPTRFMVPPEPTPNPTLPSHVQWMQLHGGEPDGGFYDDRRRDYAHDGWPA